MDRAGPRVRETEAEQKASAAARSYRQQTPPAPDTSGLATRPQPLRGRAAADTITINYRPTPRRGNRAFVSSYVGGDRTDLAATDHPGVPAARSRRRAVK